MDERGVNMDLLI